MSIALASRFLPLGIVQAKGFISIGLAFLLLLNASGIMA
jgi:hypothetical protein